MSGAAYACIQHRKIEDFTLVKDYPIDPRTGYYMLVGLIGKHRSEDLSDFNRIDVKRQLS